MVAPRETDETRDDHKRGEELHRSCLRSMERHVHFRRAVHAAQIL